jgi:hypothetical protein
MAACLGEQGTQALAVALLESLAHVNNGLVLASFD